MALGLVLTKFTAMLYSGAKITILSSIYDNTKLAASRLLPRVFNVTKAKNSSVFRVIFNKYEPFIIPDIFLLLGESI